MLSEEHLDWIERLGRVLGALVLVGGASGACWLSLDSAGALLRGGPPSLGLDLLALPIGLGFLGAAVRLAWPGWRPWWASATVPMICLVASLVAFLSALLERVEARGDRHQSLTDGLLGVFLLYLAWERRQAGRRRSEALSSQGHG